MIRPFYCRRAFLVTGIEAGGGEWFEAGQGLCYSREKGQYHGDFGLLVLALCFLVSTGKPEQKVLSYGVANKVIVVDPGHGGIDSGASRGDVVEREITLAIGKR